MVTVFLPILNQKEFHSVQNRKENCHYDQIPFNGKGNGILVFSVYNHQAFNRPDLAPLDTMVEQLNDPIPRPQQYGTEGFAGDSQLGPHYAERRGPLRRPTKHFQSDCSGNVFIGRLL